MVWDVGTTDEFDAWFEDLTATEQQRVLHGVGVLREIGPALSRPLVDTLNGSRFANMKELRVQVGGRPLRVMFTFDSRRVAILLIGGDKSGDPRFYDRLIAQADQIFAAHIAPLEKDDA
jgi:hypothetical protein